MSKIQLNKEVETKGITEFPEPTGRIAYCFWYDVSTGQLEMIRVDDGSFVRLEDDTIINIEEDYANVVWSDKLLNFSWSASQPGHLQVEIV